MRALWVLALLLGCAEPKRWEPRPPGDPWPGRPFEWLLARQNWDGSWGEGVASPVEGWDIGRVGITGLVLLAAQGTPYTQYSKGEINGRSPARAIRLALSWLVRQMDNQGRFREARPGSLDQAIATAALLDNAGWVNEALMRGPARLAMSAVMNSRRPDGTWGSTLHDWWGMAVLGSARLAEVRYDEAAFGAVCARLDEAFDRSPDFPTAVAPVIRHYHGPSELRERSLAWVAARPPDPRRPDFAAWYFGSNVVYSVSWSSDPEWRSWTEALEKSLEAARHADGGWGGPDRDASLVRAAMVDLIQVSYVANRRAETRNVFK